MKLASGIVVLFCLATTATAFCAANTLGSSTPNDTTGTEDQTLERESRIDYATAQIRSAYDLGKFMASPLAADSPLMAMSVAGRERFLNSLRFNENGITSFEYADLQAELAPTQIYRVLKLFGAQRDTSFIIDAKMKSDDDVIIMSLPRSPIDYPDYECSKRATCTWANFSICTGNC